jgi:hypothetical protein
MRRAGSLAVLLALVLAASAVAAPEPLRGPPGVSRDKVLVIGLDGTRWDLLKRAMDEGRAPNLRGLAQQGFATPTLLAYSPPDAFTMSQVGWSSVASGVWPDKHGVKDFSNASPGQATKNGYLDFLTRAERANPALATWAVANWANLLQHSNGGPIFSDAIDVKGGQQGDYTVEDENDTLLAEAYLRDGDPDAGFFYLGDVDETAHEAGSATAEYAHAIETADKQVGRVLAAIRARPSYAEEHWTVIVTTDHGQQDLPAGSLLSHGGGSTLERTSFVIAAGPGVTPNQTPASARVVDVAPTALHQLALQVDPAWNLDGRSFVAAPAPPPGRPVASWRRHRRSVVVTVGRGGGPALRSLRVDLPRMRILSARGRSDGRITRTKRAGRRTASITVRSAGRLSLAIFTRGRPRGRARVVVHDVAGERTTLALG